MNTAIILAAGKGLRTGQSKNKILYYLNHKPIFMHSVDAFLSLGFAVVLVINKDDEERIKKHYQGTYVYGGKTRMDSVYNGLKEAKTEYVYIHDAARPFIKEEAITDIQTMLKTHDAVMACHFVKDTIYQNGKALDRESLISALTPQAFKREKYVQCFKGNYQQFTDDISLYQSFYNEEVGLVYTKNDKITTKEDLDALMPSHRVGYSYDIHKTDKKRPLILGGIKIDNDFGLLGHSDADVLLHAISESIIGALGLGDLGTHFPDTDPKYKDLDSQEILKFCKELLIKEGYIVENIDASIFAEAPKLVTYIYKMKQNIANILSTEIYQINIKAGTNEGMDSIGRKEAIAASAIVILRRK